jgi:hypothetical protein
VNKEAHNLVAEMQKQVSNSALSVPQQNALMSRLLVLIAEDMDGQTRRIIRITWALVIASIALLAFSVAQFAVTLHQNGDGHAQQVQTGQPQ